MEKNKSSISIEKSKEIEVSDIKKLIEERDFLPFSIVGLYGALYQIKKFAEIETNILLNKCTFEHGFNFRKAVCQIEVMHHVSHILTFSPFREEVINSLTDITPIAIGPYIAYAENYRSEEFIENVKKKTGRVLLVMPSHSIRGIDADYNIKQFIRQIESDRSRFDTVMVCMYFQDIIKGLWKPYEEMGYCIVSAGNPGSQYFLSRLKYIMSLSDAVIMNAATTGMIYAMHLNLPIKLVHQQINYNVSCRNNAYELEVENQLERTYELFSGNEFALTKEQIEFGNYVFGLESIKSKEKMKKLLMSLSRDIK